jgi:hypothetical protein
MELRKLYKTKRRTNRRNDLLVELGLRQDQLLRARTPDLEALERLADDYDAAGLPWVAAKLASRLAWFRVESLWALEANEAAQPDGSQGLIHPPMQTGRRQEHSGGQDQA